MTTVEHPHPRRAKRAKTTAQIIAVLSLLAMVFGMWYLFTGARYGGGWPISSIPLGATGILLAAIWYFSYMETLEPELYEHDVNLPSEEPSH